MEFYLYSSTMYKNYKRNGMCNTYYNDGSLIKSNYYINNVKNGFEKMYDNTNRLYIFTSYKDGKKDGIVWIKDNYITLLYEFSKNDILSLTKYNDNKINYKVLFENEKLHGDAIFNSEFLYESSFMTFKKGVLNGKCTITQFDRKLVLNFNEGVLHGTQCIFNSNNKLEMICNYYRGKMCGEYQIWDKYSICERGNCHNIVGLYSDITTYKNGIKSFYPLKYSGLDGEYKEESINECTKIKYYNNLFLGDYSWRNKYTQEKIDIKIYNENNISYNKYINNILFISYEKVFGKSTCIMRINNKYITFNDI